MSTDIAGPWRCWLVRAGFVDVNTGFLTGFSVAGICPQRRTRLDCLIFDRGLDVLGDTVVEVGTADPNARLNILAANGSRMFATTWGDTLSILRRPDGVVLASEPYDDDRTRVFVSCGPRARKRITWRGRSSG